MQSQASQHTVPHTLKRMRCANTSAHCICISKLHVPPGTLYIAPWLMCPCLVPWPNSFHHGLARLPAVTVIALSVVVIQHNSITGHPRDELHVGSGCPIPLSPVARASSQAAAGFARCAIHQCAKSPTEHAVSNLPRHDPEHIGRVQEATGVPTAWLGCDIVHAPRAHRAGEEDVRSRKHHHLKEDARMALIARGLLPGVLHGGPHCRGLEELRLVLQPAMRHHAEAQALRMLYLGRGRVVRL
jgi:hypothetical protein